jgi:protein TonB
VARVEPAYPYSAILKEREGYVVVQFTVTSRGTVDDVSIVESTDRVFEQAAAAAVARARYRPRIVDGLAVDTPGLTTRIDFRLE